MKYGWAVNLNKLQRAIARARINQTPDDEAKIKELYISYGGLVQGGTVSESIENTDGTTVEEATDESGEEVVPKKKPGRKPKNVE